MRLPEHGEPALWGIHRAIVEQARDAIIYIDREGLIRLWNRGAESIFGYAAAEVLGHTLDVIIPDKLRQAHADGFGRAVSTGLTRYDGRVLTTRASHKSGSRVYVDMSFGLLKDAAGVALGAFAIARDCTARYQKDQEEAARRTRATGQTA